MLLDLHSGVYYGLNETGSQVWRLLEGCDNAAAITDRLLDLYTGEREEILRRVLSLFKDLQAENLVVPKEEAE